MLSSFSYIQNITYSIFDNLLRQWTDTDMDTETKRYGKSKARLNNAKKAVWITMCEKDGKRRIDPLYVLRVQYVLCTHLSMRWNQVKRTLSKWMNWKGVQVHHDMNGNNSI